MFGSISHFIKKDVNSSQTWQRSLLLSLPIMQSKFRVNIPTFITSLLKYQSIHVVLNKSRMTGRHEAKTVMMTLKITIYYVSIKAWSVKEDGQIVFSSFPVFLLYHHFLPFIFQHCFPFPFCHPFLCISLTFPTSPLC
jgi:hypothetical protein